MEENELLVIRRQKLQQLIKKKLDPFGGSFEVSGSISEIRDAFAEGKQVRVAGRITAHRNMGKSQFLDLSDISGRIQIFVNLKECSPDDAEVFQLLDLGDFLGVEGECFVTKTGEPTIRVARFYELTKALRPFSAQTPGRHDLAISF